MNKDGISVIVCTYNGKLRLNNTLSSLVSQNLTCATEIIVVDNASSDGTLEYVNQWWELNGVPNIDFVGYSQPIPGKSYAQELGYQKAAYEYLLICDDDNWLVPDYIQTAYNIMINNDTIGALGGHCDAVFENTKPDWFDIHSKYFAVSRQGAENGDVTNKKGCLYGAGMVLRKSHWLELNSLGFVPLLTCRKGDSLSSGGDTEYCYALRLLGYKIWYDDRLYFKHYMTQGRMNLKYLSRLRKAMSTSNFVVGAYLDELRGVKRSKKSFLESFKKRIIKDGVIFSWKRAFGNYEEKEQAKQFFRTKQRLLTSYEEYEANRESIKKWLPEN